jgi:hypothetical protein
VTGARAEALPIHLESTATVRASPEAAFEYLDDFERLVAHMAKPSAMMMGSQMKISLDESRGRAVGSKVRMAGRMAGMELGLEEEVIEREPPFRKVWQTVRTQLVVIGSYRLGFAIEPKGERSALRVFIDYALPERQPARTLGRLFAGAYARWCIARMLDDARTQFGAA